MSEQKTFIDEFGDVRCVHCGALTLFHTSQWWCDKLTAIRAERSEGSKN